MSLDEISQIPNIFEGFLFTRFRKTSLPKVVPLVCWDRLDLPKPNCKSCFLRKDRPNEGGAKGSLEAKVGDGMAEFQSSEMMIDGFLEMLMGKIQEVLICRLIMIDLDMGNGKDLYYFCVFFSLPGPFNATTAHCVVCEELVRCTEVTCPKEYHHRPCHTSSRCSLLNNLSWMSRWPKQVKRNVCNHHG